MLIFHLNFFQVFFLNNDVKMCYTFKYFQIGQHASKNEKNVAGVVGSTAKGKKKTILTRGRSEVFLERWRVSVSPSCAVGFTKIPLFSKAFFRLHTFTFLPRLCRWSRAEAYTEEDGRHHGDHSGVLRGKKCADHWSNRFHGQGAVLFKYASNRHLWLWDHRNAEKHTQSTSQVVILALVLCY